MPEGIAKNIRIHLLVLAALTLLVYANSFAVPFQFDDAPNITDNPIIKDLSYFSHPGKAAGFTMFEALRMRYIGYLSFALNYRLHGLDATGYHAVNIAVHLLNALLVYALVILSFRTPLLSASPLSGKRQWAGLLAASLFVVHPVNTQAVTYIVQRFASLVALFYLGSMVCYIKARLSGRSVSKTAYYIACLGLAVLAMKTKENAFTLPVAIALYEMFFFAGASAKKRALLLLPLLLTMLIIPLTIVDLNEPVSQVLSNVSEKTSVQQISRGGYLITESRVLATYLRLLVLPINQTLDYGYPQYSSITQMPVLLSLAVVSLLCVMAFFLYRRKESSGRLASFGIIFFLLALSVESTLIPLFPIYEHRLYLPLAGMTMTASAGALWLYGMLDTAKVRWFFVAFCITVVALLAMISITRNTIWRTPVTLWQDVVRKAPENVRGLNNLAAMYMSQGRFEEAKSLLNSSIGLQPYHPETYYNLGLLEQKQGRTEEAREQYNKALRLKPVFPEALNSMGVSLDKTGQYAKAEEYYTLALRLKPDYDEAYINLGASLGMQGKYEDAERALARAIVLNPDDPDAYNNLANIHFVREEFDAAQRLYRRSLTLNPLAVSPRVNLIKIYIRQSDFSRAGDEIAKLESIDPGQAMALKKLLR